MITGLRLSNKNPDIKEIRVGQKKLDSVNRVIFEKIKKNNQIMLEKQAMFLYNQYRNLPPVLTGKLKSSIEVHAGVRIAKVTWQAVNPKNGFYYSELRAWKDVGKPGTRGGVNGYMEIIKREAKWKQAGLILKTLYNR